MNKLQPLYHIQILKIHEKQEKFLKYIKQLQIVGLWMIGLKIFVLSFGS